MKLSETRNKDGEVVPGLIDQFVAERESETGDADAFDVTLRSMAGTSKAEPEASSRDQSDD